MSKKNLEKILEKFDITSRAIKLQEELAELSIETAKLVNKKEFNINSFVEEFADVLDLAEEILINFGISNEVVEKMREYKQQRTLDYIKNNNIETKFYFV